MKILSLKQNNYCFIVPDLYSGGGEKITNQIIHYLLKHGCKVTICTNTLERIYYENGRYAFKKIVWQKKLKTLFTILNTMKKSERETIFIPVLTGPILLVGIINIFFRKKVYAYEHSDLVELYFKTSFIKKIIRLALFKLAFHGITKLFVVTNYLSLKVSKRLNIRSDKIFVARNPFNKFISNLKRNQIDKRSSSGFTAYIIGRFSTEKRILEAIYFANNSEGINSIIVVTDRKNELKKLVGKIKKIKIYQSYSEIKNFDYEKSFLLNFSNVESFSLVIAEWLSSGLLVLSVPTENLNKLWSRFNCFFINESKYLTENQIKKFMEKKNKSIQNIPNVVPISNTVSDLFCK
jgi:hypothetical protein